MTHEQSHHTECLNLSPNYINKNLNIFNPLVPKPSKIKYNPNHYKQGDVGQSRLPT